MAAVLPFELSGDYAVVLPLFVATTVATALSRRLRSASIYVTYKNATFFTVKSALQPPPSVARFEELSCHWTATSVLGSRALIGTPPLSLVKGTLTTTPASTPPAVRRSRRRWGRSRSIRSPGNRRGPDRRR